ncbi:MAG TPA: PQQ-binding-like beta-propeller repeat protein [Planctomycetota bacterium]|nr:PQQ-binding-like beta-propeller repeat protein [Planctomycetota bacterium]
MLAPFAAAARAPGGGQVLWTVDLPGFATMSQPRVGPDGTIYLVTNQLFALSPQGQVKWSAPAWESYVDVGPDGTVYTAGFRTVYAYNPDGSLKWSFTEPPGGQGMLAGPTLGPDGQLYAISDMGGLGAFSLTTSGALRWNVPGFSNNAGTGLGRVQFGAGGLYFAESWAPTCGPLTSGMAFIELDGSLEWCQPISGVSRPWTTLDGRAITWQGDGLSGKTLLVYDANGALDWTHTFQFSPVGIGSVVVGPDNNVYAFHSNSKLASLTADGSPRWEQSMPLPNFPWRAAVSPDASTVAAGSNYGFGNNGAIAAAKTADGSLLWSIPISGASAGSGAPSEFSNDGSVLYVPVNTVDFGVPDQLWAVDVHGSAPVCGAQNYCVAAPNSAGAGASISHSGSTSVAADDLVLHVAGAVPAQIGLYYYGSSTAQVPFGNGWRCVGGQITRLPAVQIDANGQAGYAVDLASPISGAPAIASGSTWHFQFWFRDTPAGGAGFNLSDGLSPDFCN